VYALALAHVADRPRIRATLTGAVPVGIGLFHVAHPHSGGFFMPITYATLLCGGGVLALFALAR